MPYKLFIFFLAVALWSCNETAINKSIDQKEDTAAKDYTGVLAEREQAAAENLTDNIGELLATISFDVRTEEKDFENGFIPWASLEKPEDDIPKLIDADRVVIRENKVTVVIDYPVTTEYSFELQSANGFTRAQLLREISKNYYKLYEEEERTATMKTIPVKERKTLYNRNQTNGKYGIWGHDIADLVLSEIHIYKNATGKIILRLNIES